MFTINLKWREFNVNLKKVEKEIKKINNSICGISANSVMQLHFESDVTDSEKLAIETYWESLTNLSLEATKYKSYAQIKTKLKEIKGSALIKNWQDMTEKEKRIVLGMEFTEEEIFE